MTVRKCCIGYQRYILQHLCRGSSQSVTEAKIRKKIWTLLIESYQDTRKVESGSNSHVSPRTRLPSCNVNG